MKRWVSLLGVLLVWVVAARAQVTYDPKYLKMIYRTEAGLVLTGQVSILNFSTNLTATVYVSGTKTGLWIQSTGGGSITNGLATQASVEATNAAIRTGSQAVTNGLLLITGTNSLASAAYAASLTNGFYLASNPSGYVTQSVTNGLQIAGAYVTSTVTNGLATQVYANSLTNGYLLSSVAATTYMTLAGTNAFLPFGSTNTFVGSGVASVSINGRQVTYTVDTNGWVFGTAGALTNGTGAYGITVSVASGTFTVSGATLSNQVLTWLTGYVPWLNFTNDVNSLALVQANNSSAAVSNAVTSLGYGSNIVDTLAATLAAGNSANNLTISNLFALQLNAGSWQTLLTSKDDGVVGAHLRLQGNSGSLSFDFNVWDENNLTSASQLGGLTNGGFTLTVNGISYTAQNGSNFAWTISGLLTNDFFGLLWPNGNTNWVQWINLTNIVNSLALVQANNAANAVSNAVTSLGYFVGTTNGAYATTNYVIANFYPLTGNPSGFLTTTTGDLRYLQLSNTNIFTGAGVSVSGNTVTIPGGSGTSNHSALTNLDWTASGHTGAVSSLAGFSGTGVASNISIGAGLQLSGGTLSALMSTGAVLSLLTNNVPWISQVASGYIAFVELPAAPYWSISNFTLVNTPLLSDRYPGLLSYRNYDGGAASNNPITTGLVAWRSTVWTNPTQVAKDDELVSGSRVNGHGGLFGVDGNYIFPHVMGYMGWTYQSNDVHNVDFWGWHQTNNATLGSNDNGYLEKVFSIRGGDRSVLFRNNVQIWSNLTVGGIISGNGSGLTGIVYATSSGYSTNSGSLGGVAASAYFTNGQAVAYSQLPANIGTNYLTSLTVSNAGVSFWTFSSGVWTLNIGTNLPGGGGGPTNVFTDAETPTGNLDGVNSNFYLGFPPLTNSVHLYVNGLRQFPTNDFTILTNRITFQPSAIPTNGDTVITDYRR